MVQIRKKNRKSDKKENTIGLIGAGRGNGVTHLTVWMANWFTSVQGEKTAVLEWNLHKDLKRMTEICHAKPGIYGEHQLLNVDYYPASGSEQLSQCLGMKYKRILIDYGEITKEGIQEWIRSDRKILVASFSEWRVKDFFDAMELLKHTDMEITVAAAFGSQEMQRSVEKEMRQSFIRIPWAGDAFCITRKDIDFFIKLCKSHI